MLLPVNGGEQIVITLANRWTLQGHCQQIVCCTEMYLRDIIPVK